jgi:hypothetical protein
VGRRLLEQRAQGAAVLRIGDVEEGRHRLVERRRRSGCWPVERRRRGRRSTAGEQAVAAAGGKGRTTTGEP